VEVDRQGDAKAVVIDADASTYIMNADPKQWQGSEWQHNLMSAPPALANVLRPHGEYAIIGPGGGVDVLRAVANGSPSVTGIEINPIIANTVMRGRYAEYSYHLYQRPEVHIHVTDGRSFVRNAKQNFDVVQMTLVDTWASTAAGAFALSENSLYTVEAFREYFEHLRPDGMVAITRWEFRQPREALRVVSVAMQALHGMGVANPARNFIVASQGAQRRRHPRGGAGQENSVHGAEEWRSLAHFDELFPQLRGAVRCLLRCRRESVFDLIAATILTPSRARMPTMFRPSPTTRRFFFFTLKPEQILGEKGLRSGIDWKVNLGVLVLLLVLESRWRRCWCF
jgi:spermidine synthase